MSRAWQGTRRGGQGRMDTGQCKAELVGGMCHKFGRGAEGRNGGTAAAVTGRQSRYTGQGRAAHAGLAGALLTGAWALRTAPHQRPLLMKSTNQHTYTNTRHATMLANASWSAAASADGASSTATGSGREQQGAGEPAWCLGE